MGGGGGYAISNFNVVNQSPSMVHLSGRFLDTTPTQDLMKENNCFDFHEFNLMKVSYIQAIII